MNQTPEEEKSVTEKTESTSQGEEVKAQNETGPKVGETVETSSGLKYRILQKGEGNSPVEQSQVKSTTVEDWKTAPNLTVPTNADSLLLFR